MPYIGNTTSDFSIDTGNITNRAVTALKLSPSSVGSNGQVLSVDGSGNLQWSTDSALTLIDEDNMSSNSASSVPSQQSVKAYADTKAVLTGSTNNTITTVTSANALQGEANLTFDGSTLGVTGDVTMTNTSSNPQLALISAANGISEIQFGDTSDAVRGNIIYRSGTAGDALCFNGYNNTERMRIASDGKVGIGTTSPDRTLNITSVTGGNCDVELKAANNTGWCQLIFSDTDAAFRGGIGYEHQNNYMAFYTGAQNERFRIDSGGRVSIGNNPTVHTSTLFHVEDTGELNVKFEGSTSTLGARLTLQNNDTTANSFSQYAFNDAGGQSTSAIQGINTDQTNNYGEIAFLTRNAQGTPPTERVRIDKDGKFGINTANPLATLHVAGDIYSTGDLQLTTDTGKILMGGANDLQLYHDGNNSYLKDTGTGNLKIDGSDNVELQAGGSTKAYTYANGLFVYDQQIPDNGYLNIGNGSDLKIFHDGNDSYIQQGGVGSLSLESSSYVDIRHTSSGTDPILRMVNEANTTAGALNVIRSLHDGRNCAEIRLGRNNDANDFSASAASTQGDIQFWTTQGGSLSRKGTFINSGGLCFGTDTAAANALDDYEEGNFTAGFWASSGNFTTAPTLVNNNGRYTKIGRQVSFSIYVSWSNNGAGGSGNIYMSGLPFTQGNTSVYSGVYFGWWDLDAAAMSSDQTLTGYINNSQSYVVLYKNMVGAGAGAAAMNVNDFMNGKSGNMQLNGTYYV